jgi:hypothetical protein
MRRFHTYKLTDLFAIVSFSYGGAYFSKGSVDGLISPK